MKLYTFYTESHKELYEDWFLPSTDIDPDIDEVEVYSFYDQICKSGEYGSKNWPKAMACKTEMIIEAIKNNWNQVFIYSDVDIIFLQPIKNIITKSIKGLLKKELTENLKLTNSMGLPLTTSINNSINYEQFDLVFQRHNHDNKICAGFFACRANERTLKLFSLIHKRTSESRRNGQDDQYFLQKELPRNRFNVKCARLPETFYSVGIGNAKRYEKGDEIKVPKDIVMFHANWCPKIEDKIYLLDYVKKQYENRS